LTVVSLRAPWNRNADIPDAFDARWERLFSTQPARSRAGLLGILRSPRFTTPSEVLPHVVPAPAACTLSRTKRAIDITLASAVLILGSPAWLAIALMVRASSPGPILFRQRRLGLGGVPFTCLKFRTMRDGVSDRVHREYVLSQLRSGDAAVRHDNVFKLTQDDRITPVGRRLRRLSLDEVPQLINVLRGEMSIVGPRPPLEYEVAAYRPWQLERLTVRPGLTGHWQVSGRNRLSYAQMCELDVEYAREWSLGLDLAIMVRTPWVMFSNSGGAA